MHKASFNTAAGKQDYEAMVTAMSRSLEDLSRAIASTLLTVAQQVPRR
jgi:hypothetical protein